MMFRNLQPFELKQLDSVLNTHSYILQNHPGINLPTLQTPRSTPVIYNRSQKTTCKEKRIAETIQNFIKKQKGII